MLEENEMKKKLICYSKVGVKNAVIVGVLVTSFRLDPPCLRRGTEVARISIR